LRAWLFFLNFTLQRQARARLLVLVSFGLLALVALLVHLNTRFDRWSMNHWRVTVTNPDETRRKPDAPERVPLGAVTTTVAVPSQLPLSPATSAGAFAIAAALRTAFHDAAGPRIFSASIVAGMLATFLMPLWTLTFATESLGRARETRTLTWFLLRPLPRWSMYLACYLSALPGALLLNLGGYVAFCLLGGVAGRFALPLYGLPILLGTLCFTALFQLLSVAFARAGILGMLYAFFLEMIAGNLPGQQKRLSISYYVRCLMIDRASDAGLTLQLGGTRPTVSGQTAIVVLAAATVVLLVTGIVVFTRKQYVENAAA
jgi:ABC-2 type transport system permease protein